MWQNLTLAFLAGWVARDRWRAISRRVRAGQGVRAAVTNKKARDERRVPRPSEVP